MILAIDTDVLVGWAMDGAPAHRACRRLLRTEVEAGAQLALAPQVIHELLHIVTDPRRFECAMTMQQALGLARQLWDAKDVVRVHPGPGVMHRTLELLDRLGLGRKRILDTALAATLESASIRRLATLNERDYRAFAFLELVAP